MNLRVNTVKICLIRAACSPFRVLETRLELIYMAGLFVFC